jgi:hypothetical protein
MRKKFFGLSLGVCSLRFGFPSRRSSQGKFPGSGFFPLRRRLGHPTNPSGKDFVILVTWRDSESSLISIWRRQASVERVGKRTCPAESGLHCCAGSACSHGRW